MVKGEEIGAVTEKGTLIFSSLRHLTDARHIVYELSPTYSGTLK